MQRFFHSELEEIRNKLMLMGSRTMDNLKLAIQALIENDTSLVQEVIKNDDEVDVLNIEIDTEAIRYITLRGPVAMDVRLLTVAMKCSRELERACDECVAIAKRVKRISKTGPAGDLYMIPRMAELTLKMIDDVMNSFISENAAGAKEFHLRDKEIDKLNKSNYKDLNLKITESPEQSEVSVGLLFISKSLERIGDHSVNIAEELVYLLDGEDIRHHADVDHKN